MGYSAALRPGFQIGCTPYLVPLKEIYSKRTDWMRANLRARRQGVYFVKAIMNGMSSCNDNGALQPTRMILERLLDHTQKINQYANTGFPFTQDFVGAGADSLVTDLVAVVEALKKKEEDLLAAEKKVMSDYGELNRARDQLEIRERAVADACSRYENLEAELEETTRMLASQAMEIEDLKLQLRERETEVTAAKHTISFQEDELLKMKLELERKTEEALLLDTELKRKSSLLDSANEVVSRQDHEVQELQKLVREKEKEIEEFAAFREIEGEKMVTLKNKLEKQTKEWLLVQEEIATLARKANEQSREADETKDYFRRVKRLLSDVRASLVSSQKSLANSRNQIEEHEQILTNRFAEVEELKQGIHSFIKYLRDGQMEVERERANLQAALTRSKALERDLWVEKELMTDLNEKLMKEKISFERAVQQTSQLQVELVEKNNEFEKLQALLAGKECELVDAKLEIQRLKAEEATLQRALSDRDAQLISARKNLEEVNHEVAELKLLLLSKEDALGETNSMLKQKEEHVIMIEDELNATKMRVAEAETVVERIVELTDELVLAARNGNGEPSWDTHNLRLHEKQLESELTLTREALKTKELELLAARRDLTLKDEELRRLADRLNAKEQEFAKFKDEMEIDADDLKELYALSEERIGGKTRGQLAIEKLELEAAKLEVEAATTALHKLVEMSGELLNKAWSSMDPEANDILVLENGGNGDDFAFLESCGRMQEMEAEVCHLSTLTEHLILQAGIMPSRD